MKQWHHYSYSRCNFKVKEEPDTPFWVYVTDPHGCRIGKADFDTLLDCILWAHKCIDGYYSKLYHRKKRATVD
jgi:hypothetical protein